MDITLHLTSPVMQHPRPLAVSFIIASVWFVAACMPSTKVKGSQHCPAYLSYGDQILLNALPYSNSEYLVNEVRRTLKDRQVRVLYAPEEEYNLRAKGVRNPLDTSYYHQLFKNDITHILLITEVGYQEGSFTSYKTPFELSQEMNPFNAYSSMPNDESYKSEMAMVLISTRTKHHYTFHLETNVSGIKVREDEGGQTAVNAGGMTTARNAAIRKGAEVIARNCK
jgi:hypothetical protein